MAWFLFTLPHRRIREKRRVALAFLVFSCVAPSAFAQTTCVTAWEHADYPVSNSSGQPHFLNPDSYLMGNLRDVLTQYRPPVEVVFSITNQQQEIGQLNFITWHTESIASAAGASVYRFVSSITSTCPSPVGAYGPATWVLAGDLNVQDNTVAGSSLASNSNTLVHAADRSNNPNGSAVDWIASNRTVVDEGITLGSLQSDAFHLILAALINIRVGPRPSPYTHRCSCSQLFGVLLAIVRRFLLTLINPIAAALFTLDLLQKSLFHQISPDPTTLRWLVIAEGGEIRDAGDVQDLLDLDLGQQFTGIRW